MLGRYAAHRSSVIRLPDKTRAALCGRPADLGINRSQRLVLGFFLVVSVSFVVILVYAPSVYAGVIGRDAITLDIAFVVALFLLIAFLAVGVVRRWRWTFWLIVLAFLAGVLRVPAAVLELAGIVPVTAPGWYVVFQAAVGLVQLGIGIALLVGYRKGGVWGAF